MSIGWRRREGSGRRFAAPTIRKRSEVVVVDVRRVEGGQTVARVDLALVEDLHVAEALDRERRARFRSEAVLDHGDREIGSDETLFERIPELHRRNRFALDEAAHLVRRAATRDSHLVRLALVLDDLRGGGDAYGGR